MLPSASANWISTFETVRKWNQIRKIEKLDDKIHAAHQNEILYPNCFNTWSSLLSFPPIHINSKWGLLYEFKIFFHQVSWCHVLYKISYPSFFSFIIIFISLSKGGSSHTFFISSSAATTFCLKFLNQTSIFQVMRLFCYSQSLGPAFLWWFELFIG